MTDIEIAQATKMKPITEIAEKLKIDQEYIELYGKYKAKLSNKLYEILKEKKNGHLVLVTATSPTPMGEGKTTTTIGIGQALSKIGKNALTVIREPSLGPVFGVKGGAAGGGFSQVLPMEDINLHFTGDIHAITTANNLICALVDNHIYQGNNLNIDPRKILFKRCLDLNDRSLRNIIIGLKGSTNGIPREEQFQISVASEIMAVVCLSEDIDDLKNRISRILIGYTYDDKPIFIKDLKIQGSITSVLKDAINPNLVQTTENTPAIIHGGPFANIAHGCNSIRATKLALKLADYTITEAGFGSDLGAEKFFDIKCRYANIKPSCAVIVTTIKALKYNGGADKDNLFSEDLSLLEKGISNLIAHIEIIQKFKVPVIVAINKFNTDTLNEINFVTEVCKKMNCEVSISEVFTNGSEGGIDLSQKIVQLCEKGSDFECIYDVESKIETKIEKVAREIYGADGIILSEAAKKSIHNIESIKMDNLPICIAKTQYSLSDNPTLLGKPKGFKLNISDVKLCSGAGFIVVYTGTIMTMPGLPKVPAANTIDISTQGNITGMF